MAFLRVGKKSVLDASIKAEVTGKQEPLVLKVRSVLGDVDVKLSRNEQINLNKAIVANFK